MKFEEKNYSLPNKGSSLRKLEHDKRKLVCSFYFKRFHYGDETSNNGFVSEKKLKSIWYKHGYLQNWKTYVHSRSHDNKHPMKFKNIGRSSSVKRVRSVATTI
jgi:hypothetical protein